VPAGDVAEVAAYFVEAEHELTAVVVEVATTHLGDRSGPHGGVDHDGDDGPVAQADDVAGVDAGEYIARLLDGQSRRCHGDERKLAASGLAAYDSA